MCNKRLQDGGKEYWYKDGAILPGCRLGERLQRELQWQVAGANR